MKKSDNEERTCETCRYAVIFDISYYRGRGCFCHRFPKTEEIRTVHKWCGEYKKVIEK